MPTSDVISLPFARLSFPRLTKAKAFEEGQDPRYEASFLLDPTHKGHAKVIAEIRKVAAEVAKEHWNGKVPKDLKPCFGDDGHGKEYDGYEGMFVISTNKKESDGRPLVVDSEGNPVQPGDSEFPYAGCYVLGTISLWTNEHAKGGKRVQANLRGIKFLKDGAAFSGVAPVDADNEFGDYGDDFSDFNTGGADDPLADDNDDDDPLA
jgi:hypothetical protein